MSLQDAVSQNEDFSAQTKHNLTQVLTFRDLDIIFERIAINLFYVKVVEGRLPVFECASTYSIVQIFMDWILNDF